MQPMDVTGAWEYLVKTYDVPPTASQIMNLVAWWASFEIVHIGFDEMTITNAMTALQMHNSKIPLDQRYSPSQVAERLMSAVGRASMQLLNECNREIDAAPDKWTYKIATTDPTTGVVTYVRDLFGIVAWLNLSWGATSRPATSAAERPSCTSQTLWRRRRQWRRGASRVCIAASLELDWCPPTRLSPCSRWRLQEWAMR